VARVPYCQNDQDPAIRLLDSASEELQVRKEYEAATAADVTADVNALLASSPIVLPPGMPQIDATLQATGKLAKKVTFTVKNARLRRAYGATLGTAYRNLVAKGTCPAIAGTKAYVIQATMTADIVYDIEWAGNFDPSVQVELAKLAQAKLELNNSFTNGRQVTGEALVYGTQLLDPDQPNRLVTAESLGIQAVAGRIFRGQRLN
jgi:hypothetical protein